jgi:hypothetical protein
MDFSPTAADRFAPLVWLGLYCALGPFWVEKKGFLLQQRVETLKQQQAIPS